jgi:hypothetical protein
MQLKIATALPVILWLAAIGGCAAAHSATSDPYGAPPADFSLDLTILVTPVTTSGDGGATVQLTAPNMRPGRFVIFSDGSLHADAPDQLVIG